jgi:hypothetical protein
MKTLKPRFGLLAKIILFLAAVLLYYSLRGIHWREVARVVAGAKLTYLGVAAAISTGTLVLVSSST